MFKLPMAHKREKRKRRENITTAVVEEVAYSCRRREILGLKKVFTCVFLWDLMIMKLSALKFSAFLAIKNTVNEKKPRIVL